ncbi:PREDICTED: antigen-presenting glycoprotein CD1d-like, partial [Buceros rhinoceros silvestris]|uniref:antigen-presenting glycoprotein CD1d-like n=1 Tax=Buceros rhinoceros silvestris TaxID=175836 RepID=UPI0005283782
RPWAREATAEGDAPMILSQYKIALRNLIRFVHETAQQARQDYPLVIQIRAGCVLHPNRTSWGFAAAGEAGRDFITFKMERQRWEPQQPSQFAILASTGLTRQKSITELLKHLLLISCQDITRTLWTHGKAEMERQ